MTRPKVSPDKRQRTAQACDSCKRRKQKCNGLQPCNTCIKRSLVCDYGPAGPPESGNVPEDDVVSGQPAKKQRRNTADQNSIEKTSQPFETPSIAPPHISSPQAHSQPPELPGPAINTGAGLAPPPGHMTGQRLTPGVQNMTADHSSDIGSRASGGDEEATVYASARMLQDPTGRLLYVGDSATLSYLQLIRMIVENVTGPTPFTLDPQRHRIIESGGILANSFRNTHLLPDKPTALVLVNSFFVNTCGLVQVLNRKAFMNSLDTCYADPLNVDPSWLCLLHLAFAVGLVVAAPIAGSHEESIIRKLKNDPMDRAEAFYRSARELSDPSAGFEDADFWSVQALVLMTLYTLAVSKRNAAYAYHGMAIRSAFALGLHREETMVIFGEEERLTRRNLWKSLFVLDRFLAASLGRPTAISEEDCSGNVLSTGEHTSGSFYQPLSLQDSTASTLGLDASVRSCQLIGVILKKVYSKRKISTRLAQQIADDCKSWSKDLDSTLNWRQISPQNPMRQEQGIAILHVNLLYCHAIILLTRPFFLHLLHKVQQERIVNAQRHQHFGVRMEKFSEACVVASCHSIVLVQNAWDGGYLSRRNPFVTYFLFAATLIVLSNEFSRLYATPAAQRCVESAINIVAYCGETDPLSQRLLYILTSFRDVVNRQQDHRRLRSIFGGVEDPISNFFASNFDMNPTNLGQPVNSSDTNSTGVSFPNNILPHGTETGSTNPATSAIPFNPTRKLSVAPNFQDFSTTAPSPVDLSGRPGSVYGSDGEGADAEIDFDAFWNLPSSALTPGLAGTPTPMLNFDPSNIQGISDSMIPLYGKAEFGGG